MAEEVITKKDIQELLVNQTKKIEERLSEQTTVILSAVDEKLSEVKIDMANMEERIDKKIEALDLKFTEKFDKLTTTLDNFLKRMTDIEDEFTMMRNDINRIKKTIKEKLGVELF
jgi:predicted  nucleic acid-binding Zn-ribbon protein